MKNKIIVPLLTWVILTWVGAAFSASAYEKPTAVLYAKPVAIGMPNPASVFCDKIGGEQVDDMCKVDGKYAGEWDLYRAYLDANGEMAYTGGSKYFNESKGEYDFELIRTDIKALEILEEEADLTDEELEKIKDKLDSVVNGPLKGLIGQVDEKETNEFKVKRNIEILETILEYSDLTDNEEDKVEAKLEKLTDAMPDVVEGMIVKVETTMDGKMVTLKTSNGEEVKVDLYMVKYTHGNANGIKVGNAIRVTGTEGESFFSADSVIVGTGAYIPKVVYNKEGKPVGMTRSLKPNKGNQNTKKKELSLETITGEITSFNKTNKGFYVQLTTTKGLEIAVFVPSEKNENVKVKGDLEDIKVGNKIELEPTGVATMSLPPIYMATEIKIFNAEESDVVENKFEGTVIEAKKIEGKDYYYVQVKTEKGVVALYLPEESNDKFELEGSIDDLKVGSEIEFEHTGISTRSIPPIFIPVSAEIKATEEDKTLSDNDENALKHLRKVVDAKAVKRIDSVIKKTEMRVSKMSDRVALNYLNTLIKRVNDYQMQITMKYPQDIALPKKVSESYNLLWLFELELQKIALSYE